jgi:hypothetical protein
MKTKTYYINHKYENRCSFTGSKEIQTTTPLVIDEKQEAMECVREMRGKYDREYWDAHRSEYYSPHTIWMSTRASKDYYQKNNVKI